MIIRKPYAFIIRHFKVINLVIAGCIAFLSVNATNLQEQFIDLKTQKMYTYSGAEYLISNHLFLFIIIGLVLTGLVYYLLREKKKPTRAYLSGILYFIGTALLIVYLKRVCSQLVDGVVTDSTLSLARDASMMIRYVGFVLFVIMFIRGIGFNLGQFNFSKDIREMKIVEEDSAEFEVMIGQNNYKYMRGLRRFIREFKYYFLENLTYFKALSLLLVIACVIYGAFYYKKYLERAKEEEILTVDGINYTVNGAYITAEDFNGNVVKEGSKFVVINMNVTNVSGVDKYLDLNKISISSGRIDFYPTLAYNSKFYDLGVPYQHQQIIPIGETIECSLTFEVPATTNVRNWTLRLQEAIDNNGLKVLVMYRKFKVVSKDIDSKNQEKSFSIGSTIQSNIVSHNRFVIIPQKYDIIDNFNIPFALCKENGSCFNRLKVVSSTVNSTDTMIVLNMDYTMYDDAYFTKTFSTLNEFFTNYAYVNYTVGAKDYRERVSLVTNENINNYVFIQVNRRIKNAKDVKIEFDFRNQKYYLSLN